MIEIPKTYEASKAEQKWYPYWLNKGYSNEEAVKLRSERQNTFSLEKCLKKHGEENGRKIFVQRQNNWQKSLYKNGKLKSGYSEVSQELFLKLIDRILIKHFKFHLKIHLMLKLLLKEILEI